MSYSFESVLRNRRRSLYALIGIVIALSLVSGSWIAVDSSGIGLLRASVEGVPVDYVATPLVDSIDYTGDVANVTASTVSTIESVESIEAAAPLVVVSGAYLKNDSGGVYLNESGQNFTGSLVFLSGSGQRLIDSFKVAGTLPDEGTVAIPQRIADSLGLAVGDDITCVFKHEEYYRVKGNDTWLLKTTYLNVTSPISSIWTQPGFEDLNHNGFGTYVTNQSESDIWLGLVSNPIVFDLRDYERWGIGHSGSESLYSISLNYYIWADRGEVLTPADILASIDRLGSIQTQLAKKLYDTRIVVSGSYLVTPLRSLRTDLGGQEPLFLALSVPVLVLGIYLSMVGIDLSLNDRRREAGILKSRGASDRQVFGSLIVESAALGAISGIAGLILGALVSRFLLAGMASLGGQASTQVTDFVASPTTVFVCVLLGIALMIFSTYGPFKRVSMTNVAETLHHYSPSASRIEYWAGPDIILLGLSLWSVVAILLGSDWASRQGFSWVVEVIVKTLLLFGTSILPLLPFMLSFALVRVLTRGSRRIYSKFAYLVMPWTKELHYLVDRNIVRNPRRASNLCVMISLALAFGLFISVTMESTISYEREQVRFEVGSDVKLNVAVPENHDQFINASTLDGPLTLPGVERAVTYSQLDIIFDVALNLHHAESAVMNMTDYLETVDPSDFYFVGGGNGLLEETSAQGAVLVTEAFADRTGLQVGDVLPVMIVSYAEFNLLRFTVVGLVKGLPGFPGMDAFVDRHTLSTVPDENLTGVFSGNGALIKVARGADPHDVADTAASLFELAGLTCSTTVLQDSLDALSEDPAYASLNDFLVMEYALSLVIMTIGVGLLIYAAVHDRENELACIMARGSSGGQLRKILMGESMTLMILGLTVGAGVGFFTAYLFNTLSGEELYAAVEHHMSFSFVSLAIIVTSVVALLVASLFATARAGKIQLAEVLRIRGG